MIQKKLEDIGEIIKFWSINWMEYNANKYEEHERYREIQGSFCWQSIQALLPGDASVCVCVTTVGAGRTVTQVARPCVRAAPHVSL